MHPVHTITALYLNTCLNDEQMKGKKSIRSVQNVHCRNFGRYDHKSTEEEKCFGEKHPYI